MALENKLHITDSTELARMEEMISKKKAVELFENGYLDVYEAGTFQMLAAIHKYMSLQENCEPEILQKEILDLYQ